jgi:hypothetical protein
MNAEKTKAALVVAINRVWSAEIAEAAPGGGVLLNPSALPEEERQIFWEWVSLAVFYPEVE